MGNNITDTRIKEYKTTGELELIIDEVVKKWNKNTRIYQWHNQYRLVEFLRKNSSITKLKINISEEQAKELIEKLNLKCIKDGLFNNAYTWKKERADVK